MLSKLIVVALATQVIGAGAASAPKPDFTVGPCGPAGCGDKGPEARRLAAAWTSSTTTEEQRVKLREILTAHSTDTGVDYATSAQKYFAWRNEAVGYVPTVDPVAKRETDRALFGRMRVAAENALRQNLYDPGSATIQWKGGFSEGEWKPFLSRRIPGWIGCGMINAKNRLGGYVGSTAFAVVVRDGVVVHTELDATDTSLPLTAAQCNKKFFPSPQPGMFEVASAKPVAAVTSVADEIEKLAALRDKGIITQAEFDQQKAALLASR
ncbi:MAG: hypothetical protein K0S56_3433 [Microvirga sp.]|jgi:hypothetical protein|nr:hypothetical protein [Microvirga sp.]